MMGSCQLFNRGSFILLNIINTGCVVAVVKLTKKIFMIFFLGWGGLGCYLMCKYEEKRVNMYFPMAVLTACVVIQ